MNAQVDKRVGHTGLPTILDCQSVIDCIRCGYLPAIREFDVRTLSLFGFVARNEATADSALDFLVEFNGRATFDGYMGLKFFLEDLFGRSVDLATKSDLKERIRQAVLDEAVYVA